MKAPEPVGDGACGCCHEMKPLYTNPYGAVARCEDCLREAHWARAETRELAARRLCDQAYAHDVNDEPLVAKALYDAADGVRFSKYLFDDGPPHPRYTNAILRQASATPAAPADTSDRVAVTKAQISAVFARGLRWGFAAGAVAVVSGFVVGPLLWDVATVLLRALAIWWHS